MRCAVVCGVVQCCVACDAAMWWYGVVGDGVYWWFLFDIIWLRFVKDGVWCDGGRWLVSVLRTSMATFCLVDVNRIGVVDSWSALILSEGVWSVVLGFSSRHCAEQWYGGQWELSYVVLYVVWVGLVCCYMLLLLWCGEMRCEIIQERQEGCDSVRCNVGYDAHSLCLMWCCVVWRVRGCCVVVLCGMLSRWKVCRVVQSYGVHVAVVVSGASWENIIVKSSLRVLKKPQRAGLLTVFVM